MSVPCNQTQPLPANLTESIDREHTLQSGLKVPGCDQHLDSIFWILNGMIGVAIVLGNSFTCAVFLSSPHLRRNYMNIYLISLGVADIAMAVLVVPGYAAFCIGCTYQWTKYCWFFGGARDIAFPATVLNLLAITYDRYLAVLRPLHYTSSMTRRKVFAILSVVWSTPLVVSSLRNVWQHSWMDTEVAKANTVYNAVLSIVFTITPITVMLIVNLKLMRVIRSHRRRIHTEMMESFMNYSERDLTEGKRITFTDVEFCAAKSLNAQNRRNLIRQKKGSMSCVLIVLVFVICWLLRAFTNFCTFFGRYDLTSPTVVKLSVFFIFFQSSVNPIIYSFYRADFRQAARRLMRRGLII